MKGYYKADPWSIIEEGFDPGMQEASESIFSLGNGRMGQRANFEEQYSGPTLQGTYLAGVYYPDKTRVGWWKNGYPEYFAKVLNAPNWIGIDVEIDGKILGVTVFPPTHPGFIGIVYPCQVIALKTLSRVSFFKIRPLTHAAISQTENTFRGLLHFRMETLLNNAPWIHFIVAFHLFLCYAIS